MRSKWLTIVASVLALGVLGATAASADVLADIKKRGTLIVGSKADYRPFGYLDPSGKIIGFEPDLAADVAKRLGVKLELVPVVASNHPSMDEAAGAAAVRVDPTEPEAIAAGIREALERRDELVAAGLAHAAAFTWRRCGEIHLQAFEEAAA